MQYIIETAILVIEFFSKVENLELEYNLRKSLLDEA